MNFFQVMPNSENLSSEDLIKNYLLPCHKDDADFLGNHPNYSWIEFKPKIPIIEISDSRRIPSLFYAGGMLSTRLIMSNALKEIMEEVNANSKIQFFPAELIQKNKEINDFWITNYFKFNDNCIDFDQSSFIAEVSRSTGNPFIQLTFAHEYEKKKFLDLENYKSFKAELKLKKGNISPEKLSIKKTCSQDVLLLKEIFIPDIIISTELKDRIIDRNIFDIEFKPLELSEEEWYGPNGIRKQFYK